MATLVLHIAVFQLFLSWEPLIVEGKSLCLVLLALECRRLFVMFISCLWGTQHHVGREAARSRDHHEIVDVLWR